MPPTIMRRIAKLTAIGALLAPVLVLSSGPSSLGGSTDTVWSTGLGSDGQLGTGSTSSRTTFGPAGTLSNVDEIAGGREHVLALVNGGVYSWGDGSKGATGLGTIADRAIPTVVPGVATAGTTVTNVSTGHYHSLALLSNGTVRGWGFNSLGQLGDGTTKKRLSPITVPGVSGAIDIVAGRDMSYALLADGTVRAWGGGVNGELGNGTRPTKQLSAVTVTGLSGVTALAGGRNHVVALKSNGTIVSWGLNTSGQLGDGTKTSRATPVTVSGISTAVSVAAGADHSVAVLSDGRVYTWGEGGSGQLGQGTTADRTAPGLVTGLPSISFIGCGRDHTLAVGSDGSLWDWGKNDYGQLGFPVSLRQLRPAQVPGISDAIEAHGGRGYTVLRRDTN